MNILFLNLDDNYIYNPSLIAITEILAEQGFNIWLTPFMGSKETLTNRVTGIPLSSIKLRLLRKASKCIASSTFDQRIKKFVLQNIILPFIISFKPDIIVGIDADGVILAYYIAETMSIPYALISYEIFFADEVSVNQKHSEILACRGISFAICQGGIRSKMLAKENNIQPSLIESIPVAPRGSNQVATDSVHSLFKIKQPKVAVISGSTASWTCIEEILLTTCMWPDDWALLIHSRYRQGSQQIQRLKRMAHSNVYFSALKAANIKDLYAILGTASLGLAFYRPIYTDPFLGNNLRYLGLSSGKISCYLSEGLPVITNQIGEYSDLISQWNAGIALDSADELPDLLRCITTRTLSDMSANAKGLYNQRINSDLFAQNLVLRFDNSLPTKSKS